MGKRGEVTSSQMVIWISLIVSFVVILFFVSQLFLDDEIIKSEVCKTSVLARDLANTKVFQASKYLPLNCQTEKICVGGGKCEEDFVDTKSSPVTKIKFDSENTEEIQREVLDVYSDAILDCHRMMGEGYADFFPAGLTTGDYCVICSRIALDESVKSNAPESIGYFNLYEAMEKKSFDGRNYLERVKGVESAAQLGQDFKDAIRGVDSGKITDIDKKTVEVLRTHVDEDFKNWVFDSKEEQAVVVRITKGGKPLGVVSGAVAVVGGALTLSGVGSVIGLPLVIGSTALGAGAYLVSLDVEKGSWYHPPLLVEYNVNELKGLGCDSFENLP